MIGLAGTAIIKVTETNCSDKHKLSEFIVYVIPTLAVLCQAKVGLQYISLC